MSEGRDLNASWHARFFDWFAENVLPIVLLVMFMTILVGFIAMIVSGYVASTKPIPAQQGTVIQRYEYDGCIVREVEIDGQRYLLATAGNQPRSVSICPVPKKPPEEPAR